MTTAISARVAPGLAAAVRRDARRDVRAAAVEPRLLAVAAVDPAGRRHELHAAWILHRHLRLACDAAQRAGGPDARSVSARSACSRAGLVGVAIGSVLLGRAWNFESAVAFRGLTIFGYRFAFVSVLIAVALTAPPALRGRTMGVLGATSAMASVVGAPLGGALVGEFGWRSAILGYASMALLGATVFWLFYRLTAERRCRARRVIRRADGATPRSAFRSPVVWLLALVVGLGGFGQFTITYFVPSVPRRLRSQRRGRRHHHQHGVHRGDRSESRHRRARRSLRQARRARRHLRLARRRVGVDDDRARARVSNSHRRRHRFRLLRREPALWPGRQLDAAQRSGQRDGHREPRRRAVRLFRPADARHPARRDGLVRGRLLHGGRRGSLDARTDRAALSDDSTRECKGDCRCIGASSS